MVAQTGSWMLGIGGWMVIETERLVLRAWRLEDAEALFGLASDPEVGPAAGWQVHGSVAESRQVIEDVFSGPETYAICLRWTGQIIGSIGLMDPSPLIEGASEGDLEVGYWVGRPFWGHGYAPEALAALAGHAFADLGCEALWCGHYEGNHKSRRCMEKCGFTYVQTHHDVPRPLLGDTATEHFCRLARP